jgi:hypothetical protein
MVHQVLEKHTDFKIEKSVYAVFAYEEIAKVTKSIHEIKCEFKTEAEATDLLTQYQTYATGCGNEIAFSIYSSQMNTCFESVHKKFPKVKEVEIKSYAEI